MKQHYALENENNTDYIHDSVNRKYRNAKHLKDCIEGALQALKGTTLTKASLCHQLGITTNTWRKYGERPEYVSVISATNELIAKRKGRVKKAKEVKETFKEVTKTEKQIIQRVIVSNPNETTKDLKDDIVYRSFKQIDDKLRSGELDIRQLLEVFKEAVKMSGYTKPDVEITNTLASQKVFVTKEDIEKTNQIIDEVLNEQ